MAEPFEPEKEAQAEPALRFAPKTRAPAAGPRLLRLGAALALLGLVFGLAYWLTGRAPASPSLAIESPPEVTGAAELRGEAQAACSAEEWRRCLVLFDDAKRLDEAGDGKPDVQAQRKRAHIAIERQQNTDLLNAGEAPASADEPHADAGSTPPLKPSARPGNPSQQSPLSFD